MRSKLLGMVCLLLLGFETGAYSQSTSIFHSNFPIGQTAALAKQDTDKLILPEDAQVRLRIYNTLGQVVATVVDEFQSTGWKSVEFDAGHLPSGLYFYRLEANRFNSIKKMLLVK